MAQYSIRYSFADHCALMSAPAPYARSHFEPPSVSQLHVEHVCEHDCEDYCHHVSDGGQFETDVIVVVARTSRHRVVGLANQSDSR